jgi:hypothetical protein
MWQTACGSGGSKIPFDCRSETLILDPQAPPEEAVEVWEGLDVRHPFSEPTPWELELAGRLVGMIAWAGYKQIARLRRGQRI